MSRLLAFPLLTLAAVLAAQAEGTPASGPPAAASPRVLRVVYYHPADHPPHPGYQARITKILRHAQAFYAEGLRQSGFPPLKLRLEEADGRVVVRPAPGRLRLAEHVRGKTEPSLHADVERALQAQGIKIQSETILVFSNLLVWEGDRAREVGPFYGGGSADSGWCAAYDDPKLDPDLLASREPGGWYVDHACSLGQFNSHYIGGILHELGHGLGLPHDGESPPERRTRGVSLMGGGNHTYGRERRGEGLGTFLSAASAHAVAEHPLFRTRPAAPQAARVEWESVTAEKQGDRIFMTGRVVAEPPAVSAIGYCDPEGGSDYDATTSAVRVTADGRFRLEVPVVKSGPHEARVQVIVQGGHRVGIAAPFSVDPEGRADLSLLEAEVDWRPVYRAWERREHAAAVESARRVAARRPDRPAYAELARLLERLFRPDAPRRLDQIPPAETEVLLSALAWSDARTGWGSPLRDQVPAEGERSPFLCLAGRLYERGLYAHAPAVYRFPLNGGWRALETTYGVQDGNGGSVVFVVRVDGKERFRSRALRAGQAASIRVDLKDARELELLTEDAGDGPSGDWGIWAKPLLRR